MTRFVILEHETPSHYERPLHWDFMLEWDGVLRTWSLDCEPRMGAAVAGLAIGDHRLEYLDYEGPISNDRGRVTRWDQGTYALLASTEDKLSVKLFGARMACHVTMLREASRREQWEFLFGTR